MDLELSKRSVLAFDRLVTRAACPRTGVLEVKSGAVVLFFVVMPLLT